MCDIGTDHYCPKTCDQCPGSQNVVMLVGGRSGPNGQNYNKEDWTNNPSFFSLNGSLPACLSGTKSDIHSSIIRMESGPALFMNQGKDLSVWLRTAGRIRKVYSLFPSKSLIAFEQAWKILQNEVHIGKFWRGPSEIWTLYSVLYWFSITDYTCCMDVLWKRVW